MSPSGFAQTGGIGLCEQSGPQLGQAAERGMASGDSGPVCCCWHFTGQFPPQRPYKKLEQNGAPPSHPGSRAAWARGAEEREKIRAPSGADGTRAPANQRAARPVLPPPPPLGESSSPQLARPKCSLSCAHSPAEAESAVQTLLISPLFFLPQPMHFKGQPSSFKRLILLIH